MKFGIYNTHENKLRNWGGYSEGEPLFYKRYEDACDLLASSQLRYHQVVGVEEITPTLRTEAVSLEEVHSLEGLEFGICFSATQGYLARGDTDGYKVVFDLDYPDLIRLDTINEAVIETFVFGNAWYPTAVASIFNIRPEIIGLRTVGNSSPFKITFFGRREP